MPEEIRLLLGTRLREERERLGFSQTAFGALAGVSLRTEQDWERGVSAVKSDFLTVAAAHGVDVLYVLTGVRSKAAESALSPEEESLLDNYKHASPAGKEAARAVLFAITEQKKAAKGGQR